MRAFESQVVFPPLPLSPHSKALRFCRRGGWGTGCRCPPIRARDLGALVTFHLCARRIPAWRLGCGPRNFPASVPMETSLLVGPKFAAPAGGAEGKGDGVCWEAPRSILDDRSCAAARSRAWGDGVLYAGSLGPGVAGSGAALGFPDMEAGVTPPFPSSLRQPAHIWADLESLVPCTRCCPP